MKSFILAVALFLGHATTAFAGTWQEESKTDPINGETVYVASVEGTVLNPSWYNDERAFYAIRCHRGKDLTAVLYFGNEVLPGDTSKIEYNIDGTMGSAWLKQHDIQGLIGEKVPFANRKEGLLRKNSFHSNLLAHEGGVLQARTDAYGREGVVIKIDMNGFQEYFKKAASTCGIPLK